jgi:3-hydroxyacyl-CoA dehydrogenase
MSGISRQDIDHIAVLTLNNPPVNSFSLPLRQQLWQQLLSIEADANIHAVILTGSGEVFSAGADIKEFASRQAEIEPNLRSIITRLEQFPKWVAVAINGLCMGGGLELSLGAHIRVAHPEAPLALPEVKLGLLPGAGGTQRLPRYIGIEAALNFMLSGQTLKAKQFANTPLLQAVSTDVMATTQALLAQALQASPTPQPLNPKPVRHESLEAFLQFARNSVKAVAPQYPAPLKIIEATKAAATLPLPAGLQVEAQLFEALMLSNESKALQHVFLAERAAGKVADLPAQTQPRALHSVGVIGGGTMGSGIAICLLMADIPVVLIDQTAEALQKGVSTITHYLSERVKKGKLSESKAQALQHKLTASVDWQALKDVDLVIEAVFEDFKIKQQVFIQLDKLLKPGAILASNTSTLDINRLAQITQRPNDVVGLHFFSPAPVMKLIEVIRGDKTAPEVLATAMQLAKQLKKIAVVARVCDGFIGNRMMMPYIRMAEKIIEEGATPSQVDAALEKFGMVMGPMRVADLAGNDIGYAIRQRLRQANPALTTTFSDALVEAGRLGQKTGMGWYRYEPKQRKPLADPRVLDMLSQFRQQRGIVARSFTDEEIVTRCINALINEGARLLGEGIAARASDIDLVYIYGYGFPPFKGGPMYHANSIGMVTLISQLKQLAQSVDPLYTPAPSLVTAFQQATAL